MIYTDSNLLQGVHPILNKTKENSLNQSQRFTKDTINSIDFESYKNTHF